MLVYMCIILIDQRYDDPARLTWQNQSRYSWLLAITHQQMFLRRYLRQTFHISHSCKISRRLSGAILSPSFSKHFQTNLLLALRSTKRGHHGSQPTGATSHHLLHMYYVHAPTKPHHMELVPPMLTILPSFRTSQAPHTSLSIIMPRRTLVSLARRN
ncbi:hypothetical protein EDC04DRAFT_1804429 [Pisolithus marmoratus]|nr:hypothetical protein EDC04DRAFT_1804429 [Pisolithus marmoratus]